MADRGEEGKFNPGTVIIPEGYDLVLVQIGKSEHVLENCSQCGGCSPETAPGCVYCGTGRTHYEYKKLGGDDSDNKDSSSNGEMPKKVSVETRSFKGEVRAEQVRIGEESVVGNIEGGDNVYMESGSQAGFVFSPVVRTDSNVTVSHLSTSELDTEGPLFADSVTVYNGGSLELHIGSVIEHLKLGVGVEEPDMLVRFRIKKITCEDLPRPKVWEK